MSLWEQQTGVSLAQYFTVAMLTGAVGATGVSREREAGRGALRTETVTSWTAAAIAREYNVQVGEC